MKKVLYRCFPSLLFLGVILLFSACSQKNEAEQELVKQHKTDSNKPKNIIFLIGDGMALSQISAEVWWTDETSWFELFPYVGFHRAQSSDNLITDSAAGATAFSCGCHTKNNYIGVDSLEKPCRLLAEDLKKNGYAIGIIATSSATHATPAAFLAHSKSRAFTEDIASDYTAGIFDCLMAGGEEKFTTTYDGVTPYDSLKKMGYVLGKGTSFNKMPMDGSAPFALFVSEQEPETASKGRDYLPKAVREICPYLQKRSKKGFFLMAEGSQIDWALHSNDRTWLKAEMKDFDKTVGEALQFAAKDGQTLVIVTGDHECGGFALNMKGRKGFEEGFTTKLHTAALVPVLAFGPGAENFQGIYQNIDIYQKLKAMSFGE